MTDLFRSTKIKPCHLQRLAIVYVRQSSPQQVLDHKESTARQYALRDRAFALGWHAADILVIDEDLGLSAQSAEARPGFQRLLAQIALDKVGIVLGLEMSRLARSCKDWYHLLELCARFGVLLADSDGLYDPADYNDRLLLGLKGTMSEAELHVLKERLHHGKLNKARRGEMLNLPPIGYLKQHGNFVIDPDEQVQAVVRMIFEQFDRQGTVHGLLRYLVNNQIQIPVRSRLKVDQGDLQWHRPNRPTLLNLLHHPIYAGAYRYGHRPTDPRKKQAGRPSSGKQIRRPEECLVLIKDHLPAYITWERFEANQKRLAANRAKHDALGAPRSGAALLAGLVHCGRCDRRMQVRYSKRKSVPVYACGRNSSDYGEPLCQSASGLRIDEVVAEQILAAVRPCALLASLQAIEDARAEHAQLAKHWQLRLERAGYDVDRAARQYQKCEPENRLVARQLEANGEAALRTQSQLQEEHAAWQRQAATPLSEQDKQTLLALAEDLPQLWHAETTTGADRQRVARLLLERVSVVVDKKSERVDIELHWRGGQQTSHTLTRRVSRYSQQSDYPRLVARLKELCGQKLRSKEIAKRLNEEGFEPPKRVERFTASMVARLAGELKLPRRQRMGSREGKGPDEYGASELARELGVPRDTVRRWMKVRWLNVRQDEQGQQVIWADADELARLRELMGLARTWENKGRLEQLKKPKKRPAE